MDSDRVKHDSDHAECKVQKEAPECNHKPLARAQQRYNRRINLSTPYNIRVPPQRHIIGYATQSADDIAAEFLTTCHWQCQIATILFKESK